MIWRRLSCLGQAVVGLAFLVGWMILLGEGYVLVRGWVL